MPDSAPARLPPDGLAALDALPVPIAVLDPNGIVRWLNRAWKRSAPPGISIGAPYAQSWAAVYPNGDGPHTAAAPLHDSGFILVAQTPLAAADEESAPDDRRQAEKMEAVGRLVGGVAHDFNNLLTLISGYSEIVLNRMHAAEPLRAEIDEIRKAADRGSPPHRAIARL